METETSDLTGVQVGTGLTDDVADSLNDAVLNDFQSAEQCCERRPSKRCGWAHVRGRLFTRPLHCRRL